MVIQKLDRKQVVHPAFQAQFHVLKTCVQTSSIEKYSSVIPEALHSSTRTSWKANFFASYEIVTSTSSEMSKLPLFLGGIITSANLIPS